MRNKKVRIRIRNRRKRRSWRRGRESIAVLYELHAHKAFLFRCVHTSI